MSAPAPASPNRLSYSVLRRFYRSPMHALLHAARHGDPIVRLAGGPIQAHIINDPTLVTAVLGDSGRRYERTPDLRFWYPPSGEGLATSPHEKWMRQRKQLAPLFKASQDSRLKGILEREQRRLADMLAEGAKDGAKDGVVEAESRIMETTLRVAVRHLLVDPFPGNASETSRAIQTGMHYASPGRAVVHDILDRISSPLARAYFNPKDKRDAIALLRHQISTIHSTASDHPEQRSPLMDMLLKANEQGELDEHEIRDHIGTFLVAAVDSVGSALSWALWQLARHPELQEQYRSASKGWRDAFVAESLRFMPPLWIFWRGVLEEHELGGRMIHVGDRVVFCPFVLHHNPTYWTDPGRFDPERFMDGDVHVPHPGYHYVPFGYGGHACIGRRMALISLEALLTPLAKRFDLSLPPAMQKPAEQLVDTKVAVLFRGGLHLQVKERR